MLSPGWFASSTRHLPDPGRSARIGKVRWRIAPGEEALAEHLARLVLVPRVSLPGMELLRCDEKVFWGHLRLGGREYFLKGRTPGTRSHRIRSIRKISAARREWRRTFALRERGVETLAPAAVGELRHLRVLETALYVSRWSEGATLLEYLEAQECALSPRAFRRLRRSLSEEVGALLGRLHRAGAVHRQFHGRNVFVTEGPEGRVLLPIDCQHIGIPRRFRGADRAYNLRQVAWWMRTLVERWKPTRTERIRFLRGYYRASPESAGSFAELVQCASRVVPARPATAKPSPSRALDRW